MKTQRILDPAKEGKGNKKEQERWGEEPPTFLKKKSERGSEAPECSSQLGARSVRKSQLVG